MADSERSFADYVGKAKAEKEIVETLDPPFNSPNPDDDLVVFDLYTTNCQDKNVAVETSRLNYSNSAVKRNLIVKDVKHRAMRSMTNVKSVVAYKPFARGLEIAYRKLRRYKVPGTKKPNPDAKKRNQGEQSFADIENLNKTFIAGLTAIPAYTHLDDTLKLPALNTLQTSLSTINTTMAELDAAEKRLTAERHAMFYNKTTGLKARILSIKDAVKNQYGPDSTQYAALKSIRV
jgi:hypothetical protein